MIFSGAQQQWKFDNDSKKLVNLSELWSSTDKWKLPQEGSAGSIENITHNTSMVLSANTTESDVEAIVELANDDNNQNWQIGQKDSLGYFTVMNTASGKLLTAAIKDQGKSVYYTTK